MTVAEQGRAFLAMALCGMLLGALYDALGMLRRGRLLTAAADLLFGPLAALGVIAAALALRCDAFRLYTLLGVAAGFALHQLTIGALARLLGRKFANVSNRVQNLLKNPRYHAGK